MTPLQNIPGIGEKTYILLINGKYPGINRKISNAEDLTEQELDLLPTEAKLSIKYLDGRKYTKQEIDNALSQLKLGKHEICGSYRRGEKLMKDIDLLVLKMPDLSNTIIIKQGDSRAKVLISTFTKSAQNERGEGTLPLYIPMDIFVTTPKSWPFSLMHFTGSKDFNIYCRLQARIKGYKLNEYGLWKDGKSKEFKSEKEILKFLLGKYIEPKDRHIKAKWP